MLIKQSDYHRIYRVINSLLVNERADPASACMYFSSFGAFILNQHYKVKATPRGGLAAYNLGGTILLFGDQRHDGYVSGAGENFHCWVEADGWAIDFMAPALAQSAAHLDVPAKMFQRPLSAMAASINDLGQSGDFFYRAEPQAMATRFADWQKHGMIGDLASIAASWFRKTPRAMPNAITVSTGKGDEKGAPASIPLIGTALNGSW